MKIFPISFLFFTTTHFVFSELKSLPTTLVISDGLSSLSQSSYEEDLLELKKTPGATESISAERFLKGRSSTMTDTFFLSPGVVAQPRFGSDEARISIRGSGLQRTFHGRGIRIMQDGIPLNLADGGFDMQAIDPLAASHINVWRGGNAISNGSTTLGGAIDYLSHTGHSAPKHSIRLEAGSYEYLRARYATALAEGGRDFYGSLSHASQKGFRDHAKQSSQRLFSNLGFRIHDHLESRFFLTGVITDSEIPGNLRKDELEKNPRMANPSNFLNQYKRDFELYRLANRTTLFSADSDTKWSLTSAWTYKDLDHPIFQVIDQLSNDQYMGLDFEKNHSLFGQTHRLRGGCSFQSGQTDAAQFSNVLGKRGVLRQSDTQRAKNLESFLESQLSFANGFTPSLGIAAAYATRDNQRISTHNSSGALTSNPNGSTYERDFSQMMPKLGLRWDNEGKDLQFFTNVSGSFEPPSFSEGGLSGASVVANRAQTATTLELGSRGQRGFIDWDVTLYHAEIKNELLAITLPGPLSGTLNADRTVHQGLELGFQADLLGQDWKENPYVRWVFRGAYTYGSFRFDDDVKYGKNRIAGISPQLFRSEFMWENSKGFYAGPTFEWVPIQSFIDHSNTFSADPYRLLGFKVGQRLSEGISWFIEAKNLTDQVYTASHGVLENFSAAPDKRQFLPGDGRSFYAGIEWKY